MTHGDSAILSYCILPDAPSFWAHVIQLVRKLLRPDRPIDDAYVAGIWFDLFNFLESGERTRAFLNSPALRLLLQKNPVIAFSVWRILRGRSTDLRCDLTICPIEQEKLLEILPHANLSKSHYILLASEFEIFLMRIHVAFEGETASISRVGSGWSQSANALSACSWVPRVSLITSLCRGSRFLEHYIANLSSISNLSSIEVLIVDVNADHEDLKPLLPFLKRHKNIRYIKLKGDIGLYDVWNLGIYLARGQFVGNANLDDRRAPNQLESILRALESSASAKLASTWVIPFSDLSLTNEEIVSSAPHAYFAEFAGDYSSDDLFVTRDGAISSQCIPHCMPIWDRSLHERYGYFDEKEFSSSADWAFWLRLKRTNVAFNVLPEPLTYYYVNPDSYMRNDQGFGEVTQKIVNIYFSETANEPQPYFPDWKKLLGEIAFAIN